MVCKIVPLKHGSSITLPIPMDTKHSVTKGLSCYYLNNGTIHVIYFSLFYKHHASFLQCFANNAFFLGIVDFFVGEWLENSINSSITIY